MDSRKNVILKGASNVGLKARKGYTKFMYKDSTARDEYLGAIDERIDSNKKVLEDAKASRKVKRQERQDERLKRKLEKEKEREEFSWGFKKRDFEKDDESESKPKRSFFDKFKFNEEIEDDTELEMIQVSQFRDKEFKPYAKALKGRDLINRDFESTPLYVESQGDILKVTSAETIESNHAGNVTVLVINNI